MALWINPPSIDGEAIANGIASESTADIFEFLNTLAEKLDPADFNTYCRRYNEFSSDALIKLCETLAALKPE